LADLAVPVVADIGSGLLRPHRTLPAEPDAATALEAGAALVTASGDKLRGGPQAGLMLGRADLIERLRRHPLARAVRMDKLTLAGLEATVRGPQTPTEAALTADPAVLRTRAAALAAAVTAAVPGVAEALTVTESAGAVGGGAGPQVTLPGYAVAVPAHWAAPLRAATPPVLARIRDGHCLIDLRAIDPADEDRLTAAVVAVARAHGSGTTDAPAPKRGRSLNGGATAGHVDHGKSTLVRALAGTDPDRLAVETARGLTVDRGFATTELPGGRRLALVDVPGHRRFVPTMLAGVGPVPAVLLVVAADDGW